MVEMAKKAPELGRERRRVLLQTIRDGGEVDVAQLRPAFDVSPETIRRDLRQLEAQGLIRRDYGRAYPIESGAFESDLDTRRPHDLNETVRISDGVVARIGQARTLFMDEGITSQYIVERLPRQERLTVVTASLPVAQGLARRGDIEVIVVGGRLRARTLGTVDSFASEMIGRLNLDLALIGVNGIALGRGLTTPDPAVALVKRTAMQRATRCIVYGAHHKFGVVTFVSFATLGDCEAIITGRELPEQHARRFTNAGAPIVRV